MKRYIVLAGDHYYPNAWADFVGSCETIEESRSMCGLSDWYEIVDTTTEEVVEHGIKGKPSKW